MNNNMTPHRLSSNSNSDVMIGSNRNISSSAAGDSVANGSIMNGNKKIMTAAELQQHAAEHDIAKLPLPNANGSSCHDNLRNTNPAKHDRWHDLGRFLQPSTDDATANNNGEEVARKRRHEAAIERNSCMLEDLLATALEYDARIFSAGSVNDGVAGGVNPPQDRTHDRETLLTPTLRSQIRSYVTQISKRYHDVGFHSFEHASHVMLSATKICYMLQRRVDPLLFVDADVEREEREHDANNADSDGTDDGKKPPKTKKKSLHNTIYDPWLHFAIALSALLHDVDHKGLPNNQLSSENDPLAVKYGGEECMKSYAEWNSLDIGLSLLRSDDDDDNDDSYVNVQGNDNNREAAKEDNNMGGTDNEYGEFIQALGLKKKRQRFYKMVTDLVLCTDIASKERRELGMQKWERACCVSTHGKAGSGSGGGGDKAGKKGGGSSNKRRNSKRENMNMAHRSSMCTVVTNNRSSSNIDVDDDEDNNDGDIDDNETNQGLLKLYSPEAARAISEQIMQAADVSHTMQHFTTFTKWNSHLYHEVLAAYECGRTASNMSHPKENWYESQIGFFDHYVIPLAERLDACGAFGDGDFAMFAVRNKEQWIEEGKKCTEEMVREVEGMELLPPMPVVPYVPEEKEGLGEINKTDVEVKGEVEDKAVESGKVAGKASENEDNDEDDDDEEERTLSESMPTVLTGNKDAPTRRFSVDAGSLLDDMDHLHDNQDDDADSDNDDEANSEAPVITEDERAAMQIDIYDDDDISIPESVETTGRVSFADVSITSASRRSTASASRDSMMRWGSRSSVSNLSVCEAIDTSVDALVPNVMVRQLVDSLRSKMTLRKSVWSDTSMRVYALRGAVAKYQSAGSIRRHRGALLFVDISGFTNLSQNYPVEDFKTFINEYFTRIIDLVINFGGEVVKFAGDALYAIWTTETMPASEGAGSGRSGRGSAFDASCCSIGEIDPSLLEMDGSGRSGDSGAVMDGSGRSGGSGAVSFPDDDDDDENDERSVSSSDTVPPNAHALNIERCTACAIAINAECNNYRVSKSYDTRRLSDMTDAPTTSRGQGEVLYKYQDKGAEYEEKASILNVYCGVSEGIMAGVDVVSNGRAEFFLVGKPLKDVAKAEHLAGPGELVVSPSVHDTLKKKDIVSLSSRLGYSHVEDDFQRVTWPNHPSVDDMLMYFDTRREDPTKNNGKRSSDELIGELVASSSDHGDDENEGSASLKHDLMRLLEYHRHEAARDVVGKFTAELRRVVVLFISIKYEPTLHPRDTSKDQLILENFQNIFSIISESVSSRSGQVRQFINDDKGTVFIASFGLRGSVVLHPCDTAVDAAKEAQRKLSDIMDIKCSIGITLGKIFCGETGSYRRYEYSMLGPSVNLSARLMAKGAWGEINCDEELKEHTSGRKHNFKINGSYMLKGYAEPVPFFMPKYRENERGDFDGDDDDVASFFMQRNEIKGLANGILERRLQSSSSNEAAESLQHPRIILIKGDEGMGKDAFISGILKQPSIAKSSLIMEANRCFHDDPFYCFIPIVTRVLLSFSESRTRLLSLKKRHKRSSVLASFLANDAFRAQLFPMGTDMVPDGLKPYLSLVNDFVFKGFPLLKSSAEAKRLKDSEKVEKCIEVLSALINRYLELKERPGIIAISEMDGMDTYSKKLVRRILSSDNGNLLIIGGADPEEESMSIEDTSESCLASILGEELPTEIDIEIKNLELLDKKSTLDLFQWSLRRDFSSEECKEIDLPDVGNKIFELCGGMTHATARLAQTFCTQFQKERQREKDNNEAKGATDVLDYLQMFLNDTPTDLEEIIWFRMDELKPEEQMLLKIASVAGFDQYSFSQNLLETVLLAISRSEIPSIEEQDNSGNNDNAIAEDGEFQVPTNVGGDVPNSIGMSDANKFSYMFQGDYFEQVLDSLVAHKFLDEVNVEMSDLSSMDSVMYRFRNSHEQAVINGLMLNDQKKRTHFEVATYYTSSFHRGSGDSLSENDSSSLSTDITSVPATNWELYHVIALHYDLAEVPVPAMLNYYDSSSSLASLGVRDKAHGRLLSSYLMLEKILHHASTLDVKINESMEQRRHISDQMVQTIGGKELKDDMKILTKDHLQMAFSGDIFAFKKGLSMLTKFGQSVGTIEKEGYLFGSELYIQAILLLLLVLEDDAFANLISSLGPLLGELNIKCTGEMDCDAESCNNSSLGSQGSCFQDYFDIDDLTISFPAFSGLLTFYRDSPIGADQVQETFLANLFVAVTQEANQMIHVLRTKCILSHLYLKHGNISKALEECEGIKEIYDHDLYSLELVNTYGMDWSLICIATMASTYLFKGQFAAAHHNIEFLKAQMLKLDEFASSTKAMSKGTVSSYYLLLHEFGSAAEIADGINATQYGYFFKPIGTLQEELANRELALSQRKAFDSCTRDLDLLSILSCNSDQFVNPKRGMLPQSAETLSDRGIEAVRAALCATEIRNLELQQHCNADIVRKQIQYCQAGLVYLKQSLSQDDANNHERRKNYMMCLYQQTDLLCWHHKLLQLLQNSFSDCEVDDALGIKGTELDAARKALDECKELSEMYGYPYMQLLAGKRYIKLGIDVTGGEELMQRALERMDPSDNKIAKVILSRIDGQQFGCHAPNHTMPPSRPTGVPSAA